MSLDKPAGSGDQEADKPAAGQSGATETKSPPARAETRSEAEHARDVMSRPPVRRYEDGATDPPRPARTEHEHTAHGDCGLQAEGSRSAPAEPRSEAEHARDVMSRPPVRRPWLETPDVLERPRQDDAPAAAEPVPDRGDRVIGGETTDRARPDAGSVADGAVRVRVAEPAERMRPDSEERPAVPGEADGSPEERPSSTEDNRGGRDGKDSRAEDDEEETSPDRAVERDGAAEQEQTAEPTRERPQPPEVAPEAHPDTGQDQAEEQRWAAMEQRLATMEQQHKAELAEFRAENETLQIKVSDLTAQVETLKAERRPTADDSADSGDFAAHTGPPDVVVPDEHHDLQNAGNNTGQDADDADMGAADRRSSDSSVRRQSKAPGIDSRNILTSENVTAAGAGLVLVQSVAQVFGSLPPEVGVGVAGVALIGATMQTKVLDLIHKIRRKG